MRAFSIGASTVFKRVCPDLKSLPPTGTPAACALHVARCVVRRAERRVVAASAEATVRQEVIVYLNRLSDLLFTLARRANHLAGVPDVPWHAPKK